MKMRYGAEICFVHKKLQESLTEKRKGAADMKMSRAVSDEQETFYRNRKKYACQKIH